MTAGQPPMVDPTPGRGWRAALAFLTPFGGAALPDRRAVEWFPVVGAAMGLALGLAWWVTAKEWAPIVVAVLLVAADLGLTGMLHFDGLLDSADGLLAHLDRQRRLEVMATPGVGAFAVAVGATVLMARGAVFVSVRPAPLLLAGLWCASRTLMAAIMWALPYARRGPTGLVSAFLGRPPKLAVALGGASAVVLAGFWRPVVGPAAVLAGVTAGALVAWQAQRKLGGYTGDVLGAAGVIAETVGLIVASARW
ncbi:MAG: adenosylcobinamide-GDP ribazoletransferase [Acidimicrobiales bacterium]